jgi:hypothetical protein
VLHDVAEGKVSMAAAERDYGVVINCRTPEGDRIRLAEDYEIDWAATTQRRAQMTSAQEPLVPSRA